MLISKWPPPAAGPKHISSNNFCCTTQRNKIQVATCRFSGITNQMVTSPMMSHGRHIEFRDGRHLDTLDTPEACF